MSDPKVGYDSTIDSSGGIKIERSSSSGEDPYAIPYFLACQGQDCGTPEGRESGDPCARGVSLREYDFN